jgi:hypothetical protein
MLPSEDLETAMVPPTVAAAMITKQRLRTIIFFIILKLFQGYDRQKPIGSDSEARKNGRGTKKQALCIYTATKEHKKQDFSPFVFFDCRPTSKGRLGES